MNALKIVLTSILIWSLGLVWPQIYQWLTPQMMLAAVVLLAGGWLYLLHTRKPANGSSNRPIPTRPPDITDSRPFKPIGLT